MTTSYASYQDMIDSFGEREMTRLLSMNSMQSINRALSDATERMNSYLANRYGVPMVKTGQLKLCCCNIARYFLYVEKASDEVKERYKDEINWLEGVASGKLKVTFTQSLSDDEKKHAYVLPAIGVGGSYKGQVFGDNVFATMPKI